ncbi:FxsA family protein, partial [Hahella sp. CCB-MM4]
MLLPLIEIALFIAVGGQIGVAATLALILLSAMAGASV